MAKLNKTFTAIMIVLTIIACNQQKTDVAQSQSDTQPNTTKFLPPKIIPANKDSLPKFTPGENGVELPKVIKISKPEVYQITNLPITPGVSYLAQTIEERDAGKKPVMSKKPQIIKVNKEHLPVFTLGKNGIKMPKVYAIEKPNSPNLINNSYTIQYGDTIYPPIAKIYPTPKSKPALAPGYRDNVTKNIQYLGAKEGISSMIWSMFEDSRGNIWFATFEGAICYDGSSITKYTSKEGLFNNYVSSIFEDKSGKLWFLHAMAAGGVSCYDGQSFTHYKTDQGLISNIVNSMLEDKDGNLWFSTVNGLSCYDGKSFTNYTTKQGLCDNHVFYMLQDKSSMLWIGTFGGVSSFNGKSFTNFTPRNGCYGANSILEDKSGKLWFTGSGTGLRCYDGESFTYFTKEQGLSSNNIILNNNLLEDKNGNIWVGTDNGLNCYDGKSFTHLTAEQGLTHNIITSILEDKNGNLWFGTRGEGANCYFPESFIHFTEEKGLAHNAVRATLEDKNGNLWFGTWGGGVSCYNGVSFTNYDLKEGLLGPGHNDIRAIVEDKSGNLWFGTGDGLNCYDGENIIHYNTDQGLSGHGIVHLFVDKTGNIWIGTWEGGLNCWDGKSFTNFSAIKEIGTQRIRPFLEDKNGNLWIGSWGGGVSCYNGKYFTNYTIEQGLNSNVVYSIIEDKYGNIIIGTEDGGINFFNGESFKSYSNRGLRNNFKSYTTKEGLSHNFVSSMLKDNSGDLWMGTFDGLNFLRPGGYFTKEKNKDNIDASYVFRIMDGLKSLLIYQNSIYLDSKNRMWCGTNNALTMLDLNKFKLPESIPLIHLNSIEIQENFIDYRLLKETILSNDSSSAYADNLHEGYKQELRFNSVAGYYNYPLGLELPYQLNRLSFHFSAIDWIAPHKLQYQYKLEGFDKQWNQLSSENTADYRNIPYGEYTFKVKAIGAAKKWSNTFNYNFVIHPPWWQTWWARTLYILAGLLLIWAIIRWRTAKLKQDRKKLEQVVEERTLEISEKNEKLHQQKDEIESTLDHLKQTQSQLVQSEKMASLGQLIAGIAHEINTPLGAIKSSIGTISKTMKQSYKLLPELFRKLPENLMKEFILLLNKSFESNGHYTTSEERKFKKIVIKKLEELNVKDAYNLADTLVDMGIYGNISPFATLLKDENVEMILNSAYSLSIQYKNSLNIETAVNKASKVVFALKSYSRYGISESKVNANISEGIETVLILYHNQLKHGIEVKKKFETIPEILCYPDELNQVWTNLIHNSIHAMQEKGILEISVSKINTAIVVKIKDNGKGIPDEIKHRVFDVFFTTKPTGEGSGLGLDIVKKIIEKHDGAIDFESEEGKGTEFRVVLPIGNSY